ncbi:MAG: IgA Peptidase M64 [Gemmatimonadota bacterium]|nr:IgA Peptidase M64 [Gemmatimonadota bacterium]
MRSRAHRGAPRLHSPLALLLLGTGLALAAPAAARQAASQAAAEPASQGAQGAAAQGFGGFFTDRTMRVDYFHTGGMGEEIISLDRVVADGPWAGSRTQLLDDTNLGPYLFEVIDPATNRVIYSRGFASIFGEWETTAEAARVHRTFHESLRFPWPMESVQVVLKKREGDQAFHEVWSTTVDPNSRFVNSADLRSVGSVWTIFENGPPDRKVDLVLIGEGYTAEEMEKFHADARRLVDRLFQTEPFRSRKADFNVRAIDLPSATSGVNRPHVGEFRRTPVSAEYNIFDSERYLLTYDNRMLRDVLSAVPYEFVEILVNEKQYGGGGIFNFQATTAVDTEFADYVFVHEFGHHFAGLGDEYYTSPVAYERDHAEHPEPWEPNITALRDPAKLKWRALVQPGTPLPTPWDKEAYEEHARGIGARRQALIESAAPESEFDALFREQKEIERELLGAMRYAVLVGAFEGAMYEAQGLYRPQIDCIMFTRSDSFCLVCGRAIERIIDLYSA